MQRKISSFFLLGLLFLGMLAVFALHFIPDKYPVKAGQVSPTTIRASQDFTFEDPQKTEERKKAAADSVGDVYVLDKTVMIKMEEQINQVFDDYQGIVRRPIDSDEKIKMLRNEYELTDVAANVLLYMEEDTMRALKAEAVNLLRTNWQMGVRDFEVEEKKTKILNQIELLNYNSPYRDLIKAIFNKIDLDPNYYYDEKATTEAREEAAANESPVLITIHKGQRVVNEGEVVTQEQIEILQMLGFQRTSPYVSLSGTLIYLILIILLIILFLKYFRTNRKNKENESLILGLIVFLCLLIAQLILSVNISDQPEVAGLVGYLVPMATGAMLITIIFEGKLAIFITAMLCLSFGILADNQLTYVINAFAGSLVGVYSVSKFTQRMDWVRAGLFVAAANVVTIFALGLMNNYTLHMLLIGAILGIMNGFFSAIFAYGSLPFFEMGFKITTSVRLMELVNPNQPLLKRLLLEAPGTYHHSILVGNLGEAAADAVGADSLLVRVGAYYHDIGKLKRPYFFIENQLGGDNPHSKLTPALSTLIITSHVKDGLELSDQYGMPPVIKDFIAQHHGTSLVSFFYHKALELGNPDNIQENEFRYDAPKPQTKEAAIVMLADNVEAAVRSMTTATPGKIEGLVRKIIKERLQDGQLDESDLTFKDLDLIAHAFTIILNGIFHSRIEYPENVLEKMEGGGFEVADSDRQSAATDEGNQEN